MKVRHAEMERSLAGTLHGGLNDPSRLTWQVREILILDQSVCYSSIPPSVQVVISGLMFRNEVISILWRIEFESLTN